MKHEKKLSCLIGSALAFILALAGIGCIDSAFGMNADMELLGIYLALWAAFCGICFYFRRGGTAFLCICAVGLGFLLREGTLEQEVESLLFHLSRYYNGGYNCGVIYWTTSDLFEVPVDGGLFALAAAVLAIAAIVLCRRKNEIPALLASVVPLGLCLVVTDTIPSEQWLFLLLTGLALLLLTHPVRKKRAFDGIRLTAILLVPVTLATMLLFVLTPQDGYEDRMNGLQKFLIQHFYAEPSEDLPPGTIPGPGSSAPKDQVDLTAVGNKEDSANPVLDVLAEGTQTLYLRDQSFDAYDGLSWTASDSSTGIDPYWPKDGLTNIGYVHITTRVRRDHMLLPYYVAADNWKYEFSKGAIANNSKDKYHYSIYQKVPLADYAGLTEAVDYDSTLVKQCLRLPEQTARDWRKVLAEIGIPEGTDPMDAVQMIGNFVRNSAAYDLKTNVMPSGQKDFGLWFLNESDSGYCVHFATAATILLRAQGIPARYVSGYAVEVQRGIRKTVSGNESHAWVEYLDPQLGWRILEATPGFSVVTPVPPDEPKPTDPVETEPTAPSTEPGQTEPTETDPTMTEPKPTGPTQTETTAPTDPTDPTQTTGSEEIGLIGSGGNGQGSGSWEKIRKAVFGILGAILAITLFVAQRGLRIRHRRKRMYKGEPNQQARARWRFVLRLRRLLRQKAPAHLHELAEKAAYSQHTLTKQELEQFDIWLDEAKKTLQARPWYLRFVYRWIFAVI